MTDQSSAPAPADAELHETLNLLATVVASVSDRVDNQGELLGQLNKTAAETRVAAFAARSQTDPDLYAELIASQVQGKLELSLNRISQSGYLLEKTVRETAAVLDLAEKKDRSERYDLLREIEIREKKAERLKRALPWFAAGGVVLALVLSIALPRFYASNPAICAVMGAEWTQTTSGIPACVFFTQ